MTFTIGNFQQQQMFINYNYHVIYSHKELFYWMYCTGCVSLILYKDLYKSLVQVIEKPAFPTWLFSRFYTEWFLCNARLTESALSCKVQWKQHIFFIMICTQFSGRNNLWIFFAIKKTSPLLFFLTVFDYLVPR